MIKRILSIAALSLAAVLSFGQPKLRPDNIEEVIKAMTDEEQGVARILPIYRLRKEVIQKFPQAFIIAFKNGENPTVRFDNDGLQGNNKLLLMSR